MKCLYVGRHYTRNGKNIEEAECISAYILKLFNINAPINPYEKYKSMHSHTKRWIGVQIAIFALFAIFASVSISNDDNIASNNISNSYLNAYSETVTIGHAFDSFFSDGKWTSFSEGGTEYVDYTGKCTYGDEEGEICIRFWSSDTKFRIDKVTFDGEEVPEIAVEGLLQVIFKTDVEK